MSSKSRTRLHRPLPSPSGRRGFVRPLQALALVFVLAAPLPQASASESAAAVGEVSLVLGKAWVRAADGSKQPVVIGSAIRVNDTIETGSNGHVHVRFVDNALMSVRPSSMLEVLRYDYDASNPAASAVKLNLIEGATRAISGKAAQEARQNFRMNTPIAAIGVRGTDFVVSATQDAVRADVKEGAIVVAPFSSGCSADTLGPCSLNALELAGGASNIVEISASSLLPVLLPRPVTDLPQALLNDEAEPLLAGVNKGEHEEDGGTDLYTDSVTSLAVNRKIADSKQMVQEEPPPPPVVVIPPPAPEFTPDIAVATEALTANSQLVWGRWRERRLDNERITVSYAEAFANGREATIGSDNYALFRLEFGSKDIKPNAGVLAFNLNQAQAILDTGSARELMDVYGGLLNIDFDARLFSTSLQLGHAATGKFDYTDSGRVFDGGIFRNRSQDKVTVGVLSIDGKEAGYVFETTLPAGQVEGLTLWSVSP